MRAILFERPLQLGLGLRLHLEPSISCAAITCAAAESGATRNVRASEARAGSGWRVWMYDEAENVTQLEVVVGPLARLLEQRDRVGEPPVR